MIKSIVKIINIFDIIACRFITEHLAKTENHSYVAMFHDVTLEGDMGDTYSLSVGDFEKYLSKEKLKKQFVRHYDDMVSSNDDILITFDDGYKSIITTVLPIMKKHDVPFTVFVVVDYIGKEGYLSWEDLTQLANEPLCTIGSHSISHSLFRCMSEEQAINELVISKDILQKKLGILVDEFAFPFGSFYAVNSSKKKAALRCYKNVFMTRQLVLLSFGRKRKTIPRINVPYYIKKGKM